VTTYCWAIPRRTNETKLTESDRTEAYAGTSNCPMEMTITLPNATLSTLETVAVTWTVVADFSNGNAINNTRLYYGRDATNKTAQIVHSNIHTCVYGSGCDPFNDGEELIDKTVNKIANFTDNQVVFSDTLQFRDAGEYSVLAHIILPNYNALSRFDYAVYTKVTVAEATTAPSPTTSAPAQATPQPTVELVADNGGGLSSAAKVGISVGVVVAVIALVVAFVLLRRRQSNANNSSRSGYSPAPVQDVSTAGGHGSKLNNGATMTSTTGFESAWGGPHERATNMSLDNTNQSSASSNPYATPSLQGSDSRPSDATRFSHAVQQPDTSTAAYFAGSQSSTAPGGRKKRIDSDVEL
jgi:hypothetical protein